MLHGVDISTWQQPHDYGALARATDFVILKAGGSNTGSRYVDSKYQRHAAGLVPYRVPVASYWMNGAGPVEADAGFFLANLRPDASAAAVLDIESIDGYAGWTPTQATAWFERVRTARPDLPLFAYMNTAHAQAYDWRPVEQTGVRLWLANFGRDDGTLTSPNPGTGSWSRWWIHQYTQRGTVAGVAGGVDLNRADPGAFGRRRAPLLVM